MLTQIHLSLEIRLDLFCVLLWDVCTDDIAIKIAFIPVLVSAMHTHAALTCEVALSWQAHWIKCSLLNYATKLYNLWKERDAQSKWLILI